MIIKSAIIAYYAWVFENIRRVNTMKTDEHGTAKKC